MIYVEGKKSFSFQFISLVIYACCKGAGGVSKTTTPPLRPPPPFSLHRNNLVIDDVKAEKVQQLEKSEKRTKVYSSYGHTSFITGVLRTE